MLFLLLNRFASNLCEFVAVGSEELNSAGQKQNSKLSLKSQIFFPSSSVIKPWKHSSDLFLLEDQLVVSRELISTQLLIGCMLSLLLVLVCLVVGGFPALFCFVFLNA